MEKKKVLITGANSYIGEAVRAFLLNEPQKYAVDIIEAKGLKPQPELFRGYDVVFNVAGIAHIKETKANKHLYYDVNRDLSIQIATAAKEAGVKHFILLSTASVYGLITGTISKDTVPHPFNAYGDSKLQADEAINKLEDENFKFACVRPLMVYGKDCRGNFQSVIKIVSASPVFPRVHNKRSLIYIDNLCSFIKLLIDKQASGTFFPRNREDVDIYDIATGVAEGMGRSLYMSWILGVLIYVFRDCFSITKKAFGDLVFTDRDPFDCSYCVCDTKESIRRSV